jgi:hypothetical protein
MEARTTTPEASPSSGWDRPLPGETPAGGLQRLRRLGADVRYAPHQGGRERARRLQRLAQQRGVPVVPCARCGHDFLLDALADLPNGKLACGPCLDADARGE